MEDMIENTINSLLEKSQEAFILAIELYNRPTIKYHVEGCSFFLCNAWELLLKAYLIKTNGIESIYYRDKKNRTITLSACVKKIYTNGNDPLRKNIEKIIDLRNTSTHFITDEYEIFYGPILQANVSDYDVELKKLFDIEISDKIPENYLVLSVKRTGFDIEKARAIYDSETFEKMLNTQTSILSEVSDMRYSSYYETNIHIVKKKQDADLSVYVDSKAKSGIKIAKEVRDVNALYPFTPKLAMAEINKRLSRKNIKVFYRGKEKDNFTSFHWQELVKFYQFKGKKEYSHNRAVEGEQNKSYTYSQKAIDLIIDEITKDPKNIMDKIVEKNRMRLIE